jgi:hypothetical protein
MMVVWGAHMAAILRTVACNFPEQPDAVIWKASPRAGIHRLRPSPDDAAQLNLDACAHGIRAASASIPGRQRSWLAGRGASPR